MFQPKENTISPVFSFVFPLMLNNHGIFFFLHMGVMRANPCKYDVRVDDCSVNSDVVGTAGGTGRLPVDAGGMPEVT